MPVTGLHNTNHFARTVYCLYIYIVSERRVSVRKKREKKKESEGVGEREILIQTQVTRFTKKVRNREKRHTVDR